jgi:hypothetical protein
MLTKMAGAVILYTYIRQRALWSSISANFLEKDPLIIPLLG